MALAESGLEARARRAYERGRLVWGVKRAAWVAAVAGLALLTCANLAVTAGCVFVLGALVTALLWRGQEFADGVRPGLAAGLVPFALPVLSQATGYFCSATVCLVLPTVCVLGGIVGEPSWACRAGDPSAITSASGCRRSPSQPCSARWDV